MLVAIDGPAGAGKSSVARALAQELGYTYLDSGAMYRCIALLSLAAPRDEPGQLARVAKIEFARADLLRSENASRSGSRGGGEEADAEGEYTVLLDGRDVTKQIRNPEISQQASIVAADPAVRAALVDKQRQLVAEGNWVAEGRDIGTVVAPEAELKVFLDADPRERARRRAVQIGAEPSVVLAEQTVRDERDRGRAHSPLHTAPDSIVLDTTGVELEEVVRRIAALARTAATRR